MPYPPTPVKWRSWSTPVVVLCLLGMARADAGAQGPGESRLPDYELGEPAPALFRLPRQIAELSGLAFDSRGRLFTHDDERALVYEVDPATGEVVRRFDVGGGLLRDDFEGIAIAGSRFFLTTSDGEILDFEAAEDGGVAPYTLHETGLGRRCEVEGLAYDAPTRSLLLPCKTARDDELDGRVTVFAVRVDGWRLDDEPRVSIDWDDLDDVDLDDAFHPSAIEVHPVTGALFILSGREAAVLEVAPDGTLLAGAELDGDEHPQAEGIAFDADLALWIGDERGRGGTLQRYPTQGPDR